MTNSEKEAIAEMFTDQRTALIRTFDTGATRSSAEGKPEYAGYLSPHVIMAFGKYMYKHQIQADGTIRESRNWQKGIPLESYMQSMFRHFVEVWSNYEAHRLDGAEPEDDEAIIESLMGLLFNVQGMADTILKGDTE